MDVDEQIDFIRRQYHLISLINAGIDGRVKFVGAYHGGKGSGAS
jgi:hypothetical protein